MTSKSRKFKFNKKEKQFLLSAFLFFAIVSFVTLVVLKVIYPGKSSQDFGSTISGVLGTFLGFFGSVLVYKALIEQVKANKLIQKQFRTQQFESRYYKMLDAYNSNVSSFKYKSRISGTTYEGKKIFSSLFDHYEILLKEIKNFNSVKGFSPTTIITPTYQTKLQTYCPEAPIDDWMLYELAYIVFYFGVGKNGRSSIQALVSNRYQKNYIQLLLHYFTHKPQAVKQNPAQLKEWEELLDTEEVFGQPNKTTGTKYYNGLQNTLGHYYRHLLMMVGFVHEQEYLEPKEKEAYIKLLRSQMSSYEQQIFFLNSISLLGRKWELQQSTTAEKGNAPLITQYNLVRNVSYSFKINYTVSLFYPKVRFELEIE